CHLGVRPGTGVPSALRAMNCSGTVPPIPRYALAGTTSTDTTSRAGPAGSSSLQPRIVVSEAQRSSARAVCEARKEMAWTSTGIERGYEIGLRGEAQRQNAAPTQKRM